MRWLPTTFVMVASVGCNALAAATVDAHLAWDGYTRNGAVTELSILADPASAEIPRIRISGATPSIEIDMTGRKTGSARTAIPIFIRDTSHTLEISRGVGATDSPQLELTLREIPPGHALVAVALSDPARFANLTAQPNAATWVSASSSDLPDLGIAYLQLDGLVVDEPTLSQLNSRQLSALEAFLGRCGALAGYQVSGVVLASLRETAGCGGKMVTALIDSGQIQHWMGQVMPRQPLPAMPPALPATSELGSGISQATFLLGFFFAAISFVALFFRRVTGAIAVSAVATSLMLFPWGSDTREMRLNSVIELAAGSAHGTLVATIQVAGLARGITEIGLLQDAVVVRSEGDGSTVARIGFDKPGLVFTAPTAINSRADVSFVVDVKATNTPTLFSDGTRSGVRNSSTARLNDAILFLNGHAYAIPELEPAQEWIWSAAAKPAHVPPWIQHRLSPGDIALALPYTPPMLQHINNASADSAGWALIRMGGTT